MSNKKTKKIPIIRESFLRIIREKGYTVEKLGMQQQVDRSGKTIQRCLTAGEMQPELLDRIGRFLDVDPSYLAGEYDRIFEEKKDTLENSKITHFLWTKTDRFPYSKHETENIDYKKYILNTLLINNISKEQYLSLSSEKRRSFRFDLGQALHSVIKQYFKEDSRGMSTNMGMTTEGLTYLMGDWVKD